MASKLDTGSVHENPTYGTVFKELGQSAKELFQNEIHLMTAEIKQTATKFSRHSAQAALFGGLLALSTFPFLAFAIIGLGELLDGRYWLSSLIVAVVCAAIGGVMTYRTYQKMKEDDLSLPYTKSTLDREVHVVQSRINDLKKAAKGGRHEINSYHH